MTKKEFAIIAVGIKSAYPASKVLEDEASMRFWYQMLQDIDEKVFENAVLEHISTNTYPPNIAEIRKLCMERCKPHTLSFDEAWGIVQKAMSTYGWRNQEKAFSEFDELTLSVVKNLGWTRLCKSENLAADRANFREAYEAKVAEALKEKQIPEFIAHTKALLQEKYIPAVEKNEPPKVAVTEMLPREEMLTDEEREEKIRRIEEIKRRLRYGEAE